LLEFVNASHENNNDRSPESPTDFTRDIFDRSTRVAVRSSRPPRNTEPDPPEKDFAVSARYAAKPSPITALQSCNQD